MKLFNMFGKGLRPLPRVLAVGALALPLGACDLDRVLAVRDPEQVSPGDLENPESVPGLYNGALRSFFIAYSGAGDDAYLNSSGLLADEMYAGDTFTTRQATDRREQQPVALGNTSDVAYARLQLARVNARRAASAAERFGVGNAGAASLPFTVATLRAIEGFTYVALAEGFCGNIPFSVVPESGPIDPLDVDQFRPGIGTLAAFDTAIARMNAGLAVQPTNSLAKIGLGRAQLNRGNYAAAAAAVAGVSTGVIIRIEHSANSSAQNNPVWVLQNAGRYGVSNDEGGAERPDQPATGPGSAGFSNDDGEGLAFRQFMDPRVAWFGAGAGFATGVTLNKDGRYLDQNSDVPLASGVEARLIEAEAQLAATPNDTTTWLRTLNALRAQAGTLIPTLYPAISDALKATFPQTLAPLTDPGTQAARVDLLFRERALWLYMTGHRLGDMRRLVRQYGRDQATVFPTGTYFFGPGGVFGNDVALPVPFNEMNNTQYDPALCNVDQA